MRVFVAGATGVIGVVRKRRMPVICGGTGIWSFILVLSARAA